LLQDASGHSNVLKAGKAEEQKNAREKRTARKAKEVAHMGTVRLGLITC